MPHIFIADLKPGDRVSQFFLIKKKERRRTRAGKDYLDVLLADRTGSLGAKIWSEILNQVDPSFLEGQFAGVAGKVESFQDELQLTVEKIKTVALMDPEQLQKAGFEMDLLIPRTDLDIPATWDALLAGVEADVDPPSLKALTLSLLQGHQETFTQWPASKLYHHAYRGGLLEHTFRVFQLAREVIRFYPELHKGLALAGAVLHDIGKLKELEGVLSSDNSYEGQLLGHVTLGWEMVREAAKGLSWEDPKIPTQLEHILLSHHGQLEFGSPILPQTREALLVHMLDDLEGKLKMMSDHLEQSRGEGNFTDWHRVLKRKIARQRKPDKEPGESAEIKTPGPQVRQ
jgi:3'-5' exoribonuclease